MENFIFCAVPLEGNNKRIQNEYTHFVTTAAAICYTCLDGEFILNWGLVFLY